MKMKLVTKVGLMAGAAVIAAGSGAIGYALGKRAAIKSEEVDLDVEIVEEEIVATRESINKEEAEEAEVITEEATEEETEETEETEEKPKKEENKNKNKNKNK